METKWSLVIVILFSLRRVFFVQTACGFLCATFPLLLRRWIYTENRMSSLSLSLSLSLFLSLSLSLSLAISSARLDRFRGKSLNVFTLLRCSSYHPDERNFLEVLIRSSAIVTSAIKFANFTATEQRFQELWFSSSFFTVVADHRWFTSLTSLKLKSHRLG